jgi:dTMP kinase
MVRFFKNGVGCRGIVAEDCMIIAIDGIDGTGKGTQCRRLAERLRGNGQNVSLISFPIYDSFFGKMVSEYLNGAYGSLYAINPKLTAMLYAMDRKLFFERRPYSPDSSEEILIFDRYVLSNLAHQGAKIADAEQRQAFFDWVEELEFTVNGIPRPDVSFVLDMDTQNSRSNVAKKSKRDYTDRTFDLHESDSGYLAATRGLFLQLAAQEGAHIIKCDTAADRLGQNGSLKNEDEILDEILLVLSKKEGCAGVLNL